MPVERFYTFNEYAELNGCAGVENLYLPDIMEFYEIDAYRNWFNGFTDLKNVYISESNEYIKSVDGVLYSKDDTILIYVPPFSASPLNNNETLILTNIDVVSGYCFNSAAIKKVYVYDDVKEVQAHAFSRCGNLTKSYVSINSEADYLKIGGGLRGEKHLYPKGNTFDDKDEIKEFVVPDGTTSLRNSTFANCLALYKITIPDSVYDLGTNTFENCKYIYHVEDGVSYLGNDNNPYLWLVKANEPYSAITSLSVKQGCRYIANSAFVYCNKLKTLYIPIGFKWFGEYAIQGCSIDDIYFSLESIDEWFANGGKIHYKMDGYYQNAHLLDNKGKEIIEITVPTSCNKIEYCEFLKCRSLKTINITENVTDIGNWMTFDGTSSLESINVVSSNKYYSSVDGVLYNKNKTVLMRYPISKRGGEFNVPSTVKEIDGNAFSNCDGLDTVNLTNNVTSILGSAFSGSSITSFKFPSSITSIDSRMFANCAKLKRVIIPTSVTSIDIGAFSNCKELDQILYEGNKEQWNKIDIKENNAYLDIATIYFYSDSKPTSGGSYWHYDTDGKASIWY